MSLCCPCPGCGCNNGSCGCNYTVIIGGDTPTAYNFQSIGLTGIGVLDGVSGLNVNFRTVVSGGAGLLVTLDNTAHAVTLTVDVAAIAAAIPQATTTVAGIGETATDAEAQAKASILTFVTPSNFAAMGSSTTFAGLVELATGAETIAGASGTLAVTPAGLASLTATQKVTTTFADAVARVATAPAFEGQFGGQLDTNIPYYATGVVGASWQPIVLIGGSNDMGVGTAFDITGGATLTFSQSGAGGAVSFSSLPVNFGFSDITMQNGLIDFDNMSLNIGGSPAPNASLVGVSGGVINSFDSAFFLSSLNTETGWTNFTNSTIRKTADCNTVTLPQLAQIVDTLIQTLGTSLLTPVP